jgi:hypothetical protein
MRGRDGAERWPQAAEPTLEASVLRSLRGLDPALTLPWLQDVTALATEEEVLRARNATLRARPSDVRAHFAAQFKRAVAPRGTPRPVAAPPLRATPDDDPYGF